MKSIVTNKLTLIIKNYPLIVQKSSALFFSFPDYPQPLPPDKTL